MCNQRPSRSESLKRFTCVCVKSNIYDTLCLTAKRQFSYESEIWEFLVVKLSSQCKRSQTENLTCRSQSYRFSFFVYKLKTSVCVLWVCLKKDENIKLKCTYKERYMVRAVDPELHHLSFQTTVPP